MSVKAIFRQLTQPGLPKKRSSFVVSWAAESRSGKLVEKEIKGGNPAVSRDEEISPGVSWRLTKAARYPFDPPAIAQFLGLGNWLILKARVCNPDRARDAIDLVAATVDTFVGIVEHTIFVPHLIDCSATTHGVIFAKYVAQITKQQGRYAVGHGLSPLGNRASLSRCMHRRKVAARRGVLIVQIIDCRNQAIALRTLIFSIVDAPIPDGWSASRKLESHRRFLDKWSSAPQSVVAVCLAKMA